MAKKATNMVFTTRESAIEACGLFCSTRILVFSYKCCLLRFESYLFNSTKTPEDMHIKGR